MILISMIIETFSPLKTFVVPFFIISFILLALVPIIGVEVKGAKRWLDLYFFQITANRNFKAFFYFSYC